MLRAPTTLGRSLLVQVTTAQVYAKRSYGNDGNSGIVATVFGCTGFTGRYVVEELAKVGATVILPFRGEEKAYRHMKVIGTLGQIVPVRIDIKDPETLKRAVAPSNVVINLMSRFWETRNFSFQDVNVDAARQIAEFSTHADRFIHVSAAGISKDSPSEWAKTKAIGEEQVKQIIPWATVMKPTAIYGDEDRMLTKYGRMDVWPVQPYSEEAEKEIQPLHAADFAQAIVGALGEASSIGKEYVLAGPKIYRWSDIMDMLYDGTKRQDRRRQFSKENMSRIISVLQRSWWMATEPLWTHAEWEHFNQNIIASPNDYGIDKLGVTKLQAIDASIIRVGRAYRDPGHQSEINDQEPHVPRAGN